MLPSHPLLRLAAQLSFLSILVLVGNQSGVLAKVFAQVLGNEGTLGQDDLLGAGLSRLDRDHG